MKLKNFNELFEIEFQKDKDVDYYLVIKTATVQVHNFSVDLKEGDVFETTIRRITGWDNEIGWANRQFRNNKIYSTWWCEYDFVKKYPEMFKAMTPNDKLGHKYRI